MASLCTALGVILCGASVSLGSGIVRDSLGAISSGRGGANVAHNDNLSTIHDNPAALTWLTEDVRVELGGDILLRNVRYRDPLDSDVSKSGAFLLPQVAVASRLPDLPLSVGLGVFFPGGCGLDFDVMHPLFGRQAYESEMQFLKVLPAVSLQLGEYVSIGAGCGVGYSRSSFALPYTFQQPPLAGLSGVVDAKTDGVGITGNIGIQVRPTDRLTIGLAYVTDTLTKQRGTFAIDVAGAGPPVTDTTAKYDLEYDVRWPSSLTGGFSYQSNLGRFSAEGMWCAWGAAFDDFHFKLSDGGNAEFDALAGSTPRDTFPLDWQDSFSVRCGYEYILKTGTTIRAGYIYNLNPVPDRTLTPLLPGILEHSICAGLGQRVKAVEVNVAYQYAFGQRRKITSSAILGDDFSSSTLRAQAHWLFANLALSF